MIRVLVVDDEPIARDELIYLLTKCEDVSIVGEAANGTEALNKALDLHPDIVFLDIQMPKTDGLTVAKQIVDAYQGCGPMIVFATAYNDHALEAFEVNAVDYILKPFEEARVRKAIERSRDRQHKCNQHVISKLIHDLRREVPSAPAVKIAKLPVQCEDSCIFLDPDEIVYISREDRDVVIHTANSCYATKFTLQMLEEKLVKYPFLRTHRSYLVNLNYAKELTPWFNGAYTLIMNDEKNSKIPVSRAYLKTLRNTLEL